jgi:hypothetical protein
MISFFPHFTTISQFFLTDKLNLNLKLPHNEMKVAPPCGSQRTHSHQWTSHFQGGFCGELLVVLGQVRGQQGSFPGLPSVSSLFPLLDPHCFSSKRVNSHNSITYKSKKKIMCFFSLFLL